MTLPGTMSTKESMKMLMTLIIVIVGATMVRGAIDFNGGSSSNSASGGGYDPWQSRDAPGFGSERYRAGEEVPEYVITPDRLQEIRSNNLYPFFDKGGNDNKGDFQEAIRDTQPMINKQLNYLLPFMGFGFNYTWLSLHGYLSFSDTPIQFPEYPLVFPIQDWPRVSDPSFIGPFYSRCKIGQLNGNEIDAKKPGVYFRLERDLYARMDKFGVEIRERLKWDIRESMVGTETYQPKHVIIATWNNVSFGGGIALARRTTNTFQAVIVTDEVRTYAMFIYDWMGWTAHTEAGGDTTNGEGGIPAFVGFNAGNGTRAYEYQPYSQRLYIRDLPSTGWANGFPGRHIFRIDEKIIPGVCIKDHNLVGTNLPLSFAPENGNMLGGTMVNITGPCFLPNQRVTCRFNTKDADGVVLNTNRAMCIMPWVEAEGWVDLEISLDGGPFYWKGQFFVETPATSPPLVEIKDKKWLQHDPGSLTITWDPYNLTSNLDAKVTISLWGYKEDSIQPELMHIEDLENTNNKGVLNIDTKQFASKDDGPEARACQMGVLMVNLTNPSQEFGDGFKASPTIWSRPMPLGWYFSKQWERFIGNNWIEEQCDRWIMQDRYLKNFANELQVCPCLLKQAIVDRGRYAPDFECDKDGQSECVYHQGAQHCVRTGMPDQNGAGQQCCYDLAGYLMMTSDNKWGGNPMRIHNIGILPWNEASKIPTMSHWIHDVMPFYPCCMWQDEQSSGCQTYRFERRSSQDCVGYQPPGGATVFGDPHIYTFDHMAYTFNGLGEFVLVRSDSAKAKLDIQGRFEKVGDSPYGSVEASMLTAVAAKDNFSSTVEVRMRPRWAQWRYKLDVIVDGRLIYFDRYPQKIQHFPGVTVYTPTQILNQSHVVIMFQSGAGVEVMENMHYMATRVYLPWEFINQTRGLFGNWTFDMTDDFTLPSGRELNLNIQESAPEPQANMNFKTIHDQFAMEWLLHDKETTGLGKSLFYHDNGRSSNFYSKKNFQPEFDILPEIPENVTWVDADLVVDMCGDSYQCAYDYSTTLNKEFAIFTKYYQDQFINIYEDVLKPESRVISCGQLPTPGNGRKSTFAFTPGTMVKFDCDPGYVLVGERRRWCYMSGDWNWPEKGDAQCMPADQYNTMRAGIVSGIVLAVLVPVACIILCICMKIRGGDEDPGYRVRAAPSNERIGGFNKKQNDYGNGGNFSQEFIQKSSAKGSPASIRETRT